MRMRRSTDGLLCYLSVEDTVGEPEQCLNQLLFLVSEMEAFRNGESLHWRVNCARVARRSNE